MKPVVEMVDVSKRYRMSEENWVDALRGVSLSLDGGDMVAVMGPSGSGKSTLMHILGCLDRPDSGEVWIAGRRVDNLRSRSLTETRRHRVGFVFQGFNLIPSLTALDNVSVAAEYAGRSRSAAHRRSRKLLEAMGLGDRMGHRPPQLSGGQQQRVAVARALVNGPSLVLGDEPTGNLDTQSSVEILSMMRRVNEETGTSFVLVTHDPEVAAQCDRVVHMRDGLIVEPSASEGEEISVVREFRPAGALA